MIKSKKAVSPIIATILLIAIAVVLALIILMWARGFIKEAVEKQDKPAKQACGEVNLKASLAGGDLQLINQGNIPVYQVTIREKGMGRINIESRNINLGAGKSKTIIWSGGQDIELIPAILGESGDVKKVYTCLDYPVIVE